MGVALAGPVLGDGSAVDLVATAVWHSGEFLDVDVHELAAVVGFDAADHSPGWPIHPSQPVHAVTNQHPMNCRCRHADDPSESSRAQTP